MVRLQLTVFLLPTVFSAGAVTTSTVSFRKDVDFEILEAPLGCRFGATRRTGRALISQEYANGLMTRAGYLPLSSSEGTTIQTTIITKSSNPHTDCVDDDEGVMQPVDGGAPVAFIMANTNNNAYFSHGEQDIPVVKGQMVVFDGSIDHHTVINKGVVMMLGPFAVPSLADIGPSPVPPPVSAPTAPPTNCYPLDPDECCTVGEGDCALCPSHSGKGKERRMLGSKVTTGKSKSKGKGSKSSNSRCELECVPADTADFGCSTCVPAPKPTPR